MSRGNSSYAKALRLIEYAIEAAKRDLSPTGLSLAEPSGYPSCQTNDAIRWRDIKRFCRYHKLPLPGAVHLGSVSWPLDKWTTTHPEAVRVIEARKM